MKMNLIYKCNSCGHEWDDLLEKCPECGHDKYTVIEKVGTKTPWLKYSVFLLGVVGLIFGVWKIIHIPPSSCELMVTSTSENSFTYDCNCDDVVFKSLESGRILFQEEGNVFPCESGSIAWEVSNSVGDVFTGQTQLTLISAPHKYACEKECEFYSFNGNSLTCEYTAVVTPGCEEYVQISFDKESWGEEGFVKFSKEKVDKSTEVFAKFSNEKSGAIDKLPISSCEVPELVLCAERDKIIATFNVWMNNPNMPLEDIEFLELIACNGSEPVFKYSGNNNHINDFLFDIDPSMGVFDLSKLEILEVVYNSNKTQIVEIKLNQ